MLIFCRLPPLLRVASLFGLRCSLASITLLVSALVRSLRSLPKSSPDFGREVVIGLNLVMLGGACSFAVNTYSTRFRRPDRGPFPLASWQSQALAIVLPAALPICALALAVVIPPTASRGWSSSSSPSLQRSCCSRPISTQWSRGTH